jgi:hypothetical protein
MFNRKAIVASFVAAMTFSAVALAADEGARRQVQYLGGHDASRLVQIQAVAQTSAPYALTGNSASSTTTVPVWNGSRFAGVRSVAR